jgi:hypothetical protein
LSYVTKNNPYHSEPNDLYLVKYVIIIYL